MVKDKKVLPHLSSYANDPERIEENHELYMGEGRRAVSTGLRKLARG